MDDDWVRLVFNKDILTETVQYWCGFDWEKRPPRMLGDFSSGSLGPIAIQTGRQTAQPRRLDRLCNVHLTWSNFFALIVNSVATWNASATR